MKNVVSKKSDRRPSLFARVVALIEEARQKVASVANLAQVYTNYEIGRQMVEEEQGGKRRAVRCVTIGAWWQGMRREMLDASHVSCLTTFPLVSHLMSHAHPIHRKEPTHD